MTKLEILMQALGRFEGFFVTAAEAQLRKIHFPTLPQRHNNPGDLMYAGQIGAVRGEQHGNGWYAKFATVDVGWAALGRQIKLDAGRGLTMQAFMLKYAPAEDSNDPKSYCAFLCEKLGVSPGTKLADALLDDPPPVAVAAQPFVPE